MNINVNRKRTLKINDVPSIRLAAFYDFIRAVCRLFTTNNNNHPVQYSTAHPDPRPDAAAAIRHPVPVFVDQTKVSYTYNDYQETAAAAKVAQTRRLVHSFASVWVHAAGCGCCR